MFDVYARDQKELNRFDFFTVKSRVFFYNSQKVKSSLLSLELSFRSLLQGRQTSK